jgi:hypothetical protein
MEAQRRRGGARRILRIGQLVVLATVGLYAGGAALLFDVWSPAYPYDEDMRNGRSVAIGPHPRELFCRPTHHNIYYEGDEWPFAIYRPICWAWCKVLGYEQAQ